MVNKINNTQLETILTWANKHNIPEKIVKELIMNLQKVNNRGTIID
jgi:hypothetical protein